MAEVYPAPTPPALPPKKRNKWLIGCLAVFALLVVCGGLSSLMNRGGTTTTAQPTAAVAAAAPTEAPPAEAAGAAEPTTAPEVAVTEAPVPTEAIAPTEAPVPTEAPAPTEVPAPTDIPPTEAPAAAPIPETQAAFVQLVESFYQPYRDAENELKASAQRGNRKAALETLLPDRTVAGWTGTLTSLDTNSEGKAIITIKPDGSDSIEIGTWNNAFSDLLTNSLIEGGTELFNKLAELSPGDRVVFSGTFGKSDRDHVEESSPTENGSMTSPFFIMVFSDVTKQ